MRDLLKNQIFWDKWTAHYQYEIVHRLERLEEKFEREEHRPQYIFDLSKAHLLVVLHRYSNRDPITELIQNIDPLLQYWEESERIGKEVWTPEQQRMRRTWSVNLDFYIDCFWLVGLALALEVPDSQWDRLIVLVGNDGEDALLDRIIATRTPDRKIGAALCYPKPYGRLLEAVDAPSTRQAKLLNAFVENWYVEVGRAAKSGREKQAIPYKEPYWHNYHQMEGGYFGYWCLEAVAAVKAFGLDDSLCVGHPHYPGDLLRPGQVTAPDIKRLPQVLAETVGKPSPPPFTGEPQQLSTWQLFKLVVKNKLKS